MQQSPTPTSITIDNVEHPLTDFSPTIQRLVQINTQWRDELHEAKLEVAKYEAALRQLEVELTQAVQKELQAKAAEPKDPEVAGEE